MASDSLQIEWVPITKLFCNPANPRINDAAVPHVAASITRFGWRQPIVAKRSGEVIAGNTRLKAAQSLSMTDVPVAWFNGTDLDAVAYGIADNKSHDFSSWDEPALVKILEALRVEDALEGVGYTDADIDAMLAALGREVGSGGEVDDPGPAEPPDDPITRTGDLWILGSHRLLCGDSTKGDDVRRLLCGEKAALLSTDPPYCVKYTGNDRPAKDGGNTGKDWSALYREIDIKDVPAFMNGWLSACLAHCEERIGIYVWHAHVMYPIIVEAFAKNGLIPHQQIVWVKPCATFSHSFYRYRHEPCIFGWRQGFKPDHGQAALETTWMCDWEGKARVVGNEHPCQKPTRLFEIPMEQHTSAGAICIEPFSGSGSQLIAAEKLRRRCFAMEVSPAFVDVGIRRWQGATGKEAILDGEEKSYADVAAEREKS